MNPQPDRYIFAENNSPDDTLRKVARFHAPKEIIRTWYRPDARDHLDTQYDLIGIERQFLLTRARQLNPDFAVFIDSDVMVMQENLLDRLTTWGDRADIVGGPYQRIYPEGVYLSCLWHSPNQDASKPFRLRRKLRVWPFDDSLVAVSGGCMCLSNRILQDRRVNFYPVKRPELSLPVSEDYGYCLEAKRFHYRVGLDCTIRLRHWVAPDHMRGKAWVVDPDRKPMPFTYA